jgi:hypothetical protein
MVDDYLKVVKVSRAKLAKEYAESKSKKLKSVSLKRSSKNIQILIAEVDHDGNIIKSKVVESQEIGIKILLYLFLIMKINILNKEL